MSAYAYFYGKSFALLQSKKIIFIAIGCGSFCKVYVKIVLLSTENKLFRFKQVLGFRCEEKEIFITFQTVCIAQNILDQKNLLKKELLSSRYLLLIM